jgi:hypothetical protein
VKAILTLTAALSLAALSLGQADLSTKIESPMLPPGTWVRPKLALATTETPPKIDGDLSDPCWKSATKGSGFFRFPTKEAIDQQTEVWICSSKKSLFVAFHCIESHPESIQAKETQRNGNLDQDDRVLVLIDSQCSRRNASEFWVNARGTQLQNLEGGSADNQAWQGDWVAATKRTSDGWVVEIEIPFSLLKYPKGAHQFGMFVARKKSSETSFMTWPFVPPEGNGGNIAPYMSDFDGINPPAFAPKAVISPYSLSTTGQGTSSRFGMDIKVPFTTTMTGLATIKPDFSTVEGAVQDLSFSYTEKFVPDRRPFFAENGGFLDDQNLFYSQRILDVDYGLKVTGRQGKTSMGFLSTASEIGSKQVADIATFDQELGQYAGFGGTYMSSHQMGLGGQVLQARGSYGWAKGARKTTFFANVTDAQLDNGQKGKNMFAQVRSNAGNGQWNGNLNFSQTDANFGNPLGLVSETDIKGVGMFLNRNDLYTKGKMESTGVYFGANSYDHVDGSFFHNSFFGGYEADFRKGYNLGLDASIGNREAFHDQTMSPSIAWNQKSLLSRGKFAIDFGHLENKAYRYTSITQGFPVGQALSFNINFGQLMLGSSTNWQTVLSGTYRIDPMQTFGGRMVTQDGKTNLYLSYGKRTRKGNDVFVLLGDPNSPTTKRAITLKIVRTF